ncbi:beta-N-acetylhexosaminidase [Micromonospora sp. NPDC047620]|uniref:beta-N-acetylhexosaminidase n=1 Tax=Micromonospora sp. NPDC047620 TaxID=3364251 RepID=UPI00372204B6
MTSLIPYPASIRRHSGALHVAGPVPVAAVPEAEGVADWLAEVPGFTRAVVSDAPVRLALDDRLAPEGYRLTVDERGVEITGGAPAGVFYGAQTLRQLLPEGASGRTVSLPYLEVADAPRFGWRGAMLDVARHFMPKEFVLRFIDLLALHKLNVLHLHLTDDQGWRLEIPRYPRLTEIGAWRAETLVGHARQTPRRYDGVRHGGFYTRQDIQEIVTYAATRFVTVVPEIDSPGHSQAAIAAYPQLGNTGRQLDVWTDWGISEHVLDISETTVGFYRDVLDEVMALFPGNYLHLGGDECPTGQWRANPAVTARLAELGLSDERALLGWYVGELASFVTDRGRRPVFWYDTETALRVPNAIAMPWRGDGAAMAAHQDGHDVVLASHEHLYLDYYQSQDRDTEPLAIGGHTSLERVYEFDADQPVGALGAQCQLWTEYMPRPEDVERMAFPRLCAFSETVWSTAPRHSFASFRDRVTAHLPRLAAAGATYRPLDAIPSPRTEPQPFLREAPTDAHSRG